MPSSSHAIQTARAEPAIGTNRLESFSDGVIAVAITLLVLGLNVPQVSSPHSHETLAHALLRSWPQDAAYVVSFLTIGIIWINHHVMINRLREADHSILICNLLLLMSIGILPFATSLMAAYLRQSHGQSVAAAVYAGAFLVMSIMFATLNRQILLKRSHMLHPELPLAQRRRILSRSTTGLVPYVIATALAFVSPYITLGICAAVAFYYALPIAGGIERHRAEPT
ncbi:MAG: TMEM175 family protein [Solirubrobacteraceae bacterium]